MISVITPSKNIISQGREPFFRKAMAALYNQTYQDFEHILVDSNSLDGTADLLQEYLKKDEIDILISEKDKNLHEAINKGLKLAKGEYVYIMNTDDYLTTDNFFSKSLGAFKKYKDISYTHADRIIKKRDGSSPTVKKGDERVAFFRMPFRWQTMLIKREIYEEFGPFDERFFIASDYQFMLKMILARKKGHYFPETFICSLDGGITKDREKCIEEVSLVLFEVYGKKYGLSLNDCKNIYKKTISQSLFAKINSNIKDDRIINSLKYCYENEKAN